MRFKKHSSLFAIAFCFILIAFQVAAFLFVEESSIVIMLVGTLPFSLMALWQYSVRKAVLEVSENRILQSGLFNTQEILGNDIVGFRMHESFADRYGPSGVKLIGRHGDEMKISVNSFIEAQKLWDWIHANYANLDQDAADLEIAGLEQKYAQVSSDKKSAASSFSFYYHLFALASLISFFFPAHFVFWPWVLIAPLGLIAIFYFDGLLVFRKSQTLLKADNRHSRSRRGTTLLEELGKLEGQDPEGAAYREFREKVSSMHFDPTIDLVWGLGIPSVVLTVNVLMDINFYSFSILFWIWVGASTLILFFLAVFAFFRSEQANKLINFVLILGLLFSFSFGVFASLNCALDRSTPKIYYPVVQERRVEGRFSKRKSWIRIGQWGKNKPGRDMVKKLKVGDKVLVRFRKGALGTSWYEIELE